MSNNLIKKEKGFVNRIKVWMKDKWNKIFNYNNGFKSLAPVDLGGHGRMFETHDKFGNNYLFKPAESKSGLSEPFRADIQQAVYKLQQVVNPQGAIPCFATTIDGLYGAVQERIETSDSFNILNWQLYGSEIPQNILDEILQEYVVDWVSGNFDSHGSHFLVDSNGHVKCCDKEQSLRYLFDADSQKPSLSYNPNASYGEVEPIYNTIFRRFISGELENIDFNIIYDALQRLDSIPNEQYLSYFETYIEKLSEGDKTVYFNQILERKHSARIQIEEFLKDILKMREQYEKTKDEQNVVEERSVTDDQTEIADADTPIPTLPNIIWDTVSEEDIQQADALQKAAEEFLRKQLEKYGITKEEWEEVEKYKGADYFLPSTLLHRIDLFQYNRPQYGDVFSNPDWFSPEKAIDSYCKIYSTMCKFAKRNNKKIDICRVDSSLFSDEMKQSGQTESVLSFSHSYVGYLPKFEYGKNDICYLDGILEKGTPHIDFVEIYGEDNEGEVLIPPFLNISYGNNGSKTLAYPEYDVYISPNQSRILSDEEKGKMDLLRQSITNSSIPYEYYMHWYNTSRTILGHQGDDPESIRLREEFFKWQDEFKEYLQLRFIEIENEISHPKLKPTDFLSWGIQRAGTGREKFKAVINQVGDLFKEISNPLDKDEQDR